MIDQGAVIAPDGYFVGFTDRGQATHTARPGEYAAVCGQWLTMGWNRQIDRDYLPVTCKRCLKALEANASTAEDA